MAQARRRLLNPFDQDIDLSTTTGAKIYKSAIEPLATKYDGSSAKASYFQTKVIDASVSRCWQSICTITMDGNQVDVLKHPGKLTEGNLRDYAELTWRDLDPNEDANYQKQLRHNMLGQFLIESITPELRQRIEPKKDDFTFGEVYGEAKAIDGLLLYKILIGEGALGSRAGVSANKEKLHALTLKNYDYNVRALIDDFNATLTQIESKGERFTEQLECLFKAFRTAHDQEFLNYIQKFKDDWDEGKDIAWQMLSDKAVAKYKSRVEEGKWTKKDPSKMQIIALTAALNEVSKVMGRTKHPNAPGANNKKQARNEYSEVDQAGKINAKGYADWKTIAPKDNDPQEQVVNGRTYYWCPNHSTNGLWTAHKASDCALKKGGGGGQKQGRGFVRGTLKQGGRGGGRSGRFGGRGGSRTGYDLSNLKPNSKLTTALSSVEKTLRWADETSDGEDSVFL